MAERQDLPTDMMCRRIPLPLCGHFVLHGTTVTIATNSEPILRAAEAAGFAILSDTDKFPGVKCEIVGTRGMSFVEDWESNVMLGNDSLYLSMGPEQWFAFDFETGEGAGFFAQSDSVTDTETNAELYLLTVACNVGAALRRNVEAGGHE